MGKKINLPILPLAPDVSSRDGGGHEHDVAGGRRSLKKPSLDDARTRLGGRTNEDQPALAGITPGRVVNVFANDGEAHVAVVVFANADEVHILIDGRRLRRVPPDAVHDYTGETPTELRQIAADAHVFSRIAEGERVRYTDDVGGLLDGKLIEKCRYGALVAREDGTLIAVGFRKLWPASGPGAACA